MYTEEPDGYIDYIWDLTDYSPEGDDEWWRGQVNFNTHRVLLLLIIHMHLNFSFQLVFEVTHGSNESQSGYAALDSIKFDYSDPSCEVEPPDAIVNPTDPPITSTASPPSEFTHSVSLIIIFICLYLQPFSATSRTPTSAT